jgi:N-acetyl-gamma-glutamyl-phosphate reductase common form
MKIPAIVLGATGYVGGELLRLISGHPHFELAAAISGSRAGDRVSDVFPHLAHVYPDAEFVAPDAWADAVPAPDRLALFSAAPHGAAANAIAGMLDEAAAKKLDVHCVDASADFRFDDLETFAGVYGFEHPQPELARQFQCAVPEHASAISTPHAAHPGCFATAMLLPAVPLAAAGLVGADLFVSAITGSTGSGRTPVAGTHHPERNSNLYAYKPLAHRHAPEVESLIKRAGGKETRVHFVPHSGPFARGIHATLQARLVGSAGLADIRAALENAYAGSPFVHIIDGTPRIKNVVTSNQALIGVATARETVTVMCVIDNLVKGAAGGAMQWMNRLWELPEAAGLMAPAPAWT